MPGRSDRWRISPAIPTIANLTLAALWGFSAVGGWGEAAFCGEADHLDQHCADRFDRTVVISLTPAALATVLALAAWALPPIRRLPDRLDSLLISAAVLWVLAEGILFIGGYLAKP